MKRALVASVTLAPPGGPPLTLRYWLLTQPIDGRDRYGVAVTDSAGGHAALSDVTTRRSVALALLRRMAAGGVTPLTAKEVVVDFLADDRLT